jgi:hypothetical protein
MNFKIYPKNPISEISNNISNLLPKMQDNILLASARFQVPDDKSKKFGASSQKPDPLAGY